MNETEMKLADLKRIAELREREYEAASLCLFKRMREAVEGCIEQGGFEGYELIRRFDKFTLESFEIVKADRREIDLYFHCGLAEMKGEGFDRELKLNVSSFGCFGGGDAKAVEYYTVIGHLATHLKELNEKIAAFPEWEDFVIAGRAFCCSQSEYEKAERAAASARDADELNKIAEKLTGGAVIAVGVIRDRNWKAERFVTKTVERRMAKRIWFRGDLRQYNVMTVAEYIRAGLDKCGWSFANDVKIENF